MSQTASSPSTAARRPKSKIPSKARSKRLATTAAPRRTLPYVVLGNVRFRTWFDNIYPEEIVPRDTDTIYVCQYCFRYTPCEDSFVIHLRRCGVKAEGKPPGLKVYDDGKGYAVWEIDGEKEKLFAQNLSLFAKLFLDHKSVFFDVSSFLYYILTFTPENAGSTTPSIAEEVNSSHGRSGSGSESRATISSPPDFHVLGYFSKEKLAWDPNNLACILIFPPYQRRQLGKLLMGISYKLSAWEFEGGMLGGPERPLSEMGRKSYLNFWQERLVRFFLLGPPGGKVHVQTITRSAATKRAVKKREGKRVVGRFEGGRLSVGDIGMAVGMLAEDVALALKEMGIVEVSREIDTKMVEAEESHGTKRKRNSNVTLISEDSNEEKEIGIVRKSTVLAFAKFHHIALNDPVKEEGFIGEVASDYEDGDRNSDSEYGNDDNDEMEE
ncbi:hypothetical protein KEM54_005960 [Ascosphaera aggregata]|nr:hypothetical protein KEM54_005960 [Ascosphaera aggregata]